MIIGIVIGAGIFLFQYVISKGKWVGGGDIRLGMLMGVILGWPRILVALFLAYILGAIVSLVMVVFKKKELQGSTPFGTYLTIGTFVTMLWGAKIVEWYVGLLK
jgi:prepilin signal peptidase PulO-like enzyme (type II secretory pathway)